MQQTLEGEFSLAHITFKTTAPTSSSAELCLGQRSAQRPEMRSQTAARHAVLRQKREDEQKKASALQAALKVRKTRKSKKRRIPSPSTVRKNAASLRAKRVPNGGKLELHYKDGTLVLHHELYAIDTGFRLSCHNCYKHYDSIKYKTLWPSFRAHLLTCDRNAVRWRTRAASARCCGRGSRPRKMTARSYAWRSAGCLQRTWSP